MSYKKSEKKNYKSKSIGPTPIIVDCMLNGSGSSTKIQNIYTNIRVACGLMQKKPFMDEIYPQKQLSIESVLYGSAIYQIDGSIITFKVYKFFDEIEEKMNESRRNDLSKKYISATRMEIYVKSKDSSLVDKINEIITQFPS